MANIARIKRRAAGGAAGAPTSLANAEVAFNEQDLTLYYGLGTGGANGTATSVIPIAGAGAFVTLTTNQTISGVKTFSASPQVPTAAAGDSSQNAASTAFVQNAVGNAGGSQAPNTVYAGPATGSTNAAPTFRALVVVDIPTLTSVKISDFSAAADARISAQKGVANGLAPLDANQYVPLANLPPSVRNAMHYVGTWNASTNTPTLTSGTAPAGGTGSIYKVATAGTTTLDGNSQWNVGDEAVYNGTTWDKWDGLGSEVLSVNGFVGAVTLTTDNVAEGTTNLYHTSARTLATALVGLVTTSGAVITTSDTVLTAFGKLQNQVSARLSTANNLSEITGTSNQLAARTNIGVGTAGTQATAFFLQTANNLSDISGATNQAAARTNLGLGTASTQATGFFLQTANNLSDISGATNQAAARTNLGLGTMSTQNSNAIAVTGGTITGTAWTGGTIDGVTFDFGTF